MRNRQFGYAAAVNHGAEGSRFGVEQRDFRAHRHALLGGANFQFDFDFDPVVDSNFDIFPDEFAEAGLFHAYSR